MNLGKTLFAQLMEFVPWTSFARIVARYSGDARLALDGWDCSQILLHPRLYRKTSPAHQTTTITPRFDQQQPNFATEPSQYPAATGSPNIYLGSRSESWDQPLSTSR